MITAAANLPAPSALDKLCLAFSLSTFERDILLLCVGMELDPKFELLFTNAQSQSKCTYPTISLALSSLPEPDLRVLAPQNPLQNFSLVEIGAGQALTHCSLRIDKRILCYLLGEPCVDEKLVGIVQPMEVQAYSNLSLQPSHQTIASQLIALWSAAADTSITPIVQLCGDEVVAKQTIAAAACLYMGCNLSVMEASALPSNPNDLHHLLKVWERESLLTNSALLLDCDEVSSMDIV